MTDQERIELQLLGGYIGSPLTEEQMEFASDFRKSTLTFASPGTGKTHTLVAGLVLLQRYHKVRGQEVNCMSFTKATTIEIKKRYDRLAKRVGVANSVVFNTFHSLSRKILKEAYPYAEVIDKINIDRAVADLQRYLMEAGIETNDNGFIKKVLKAINSLNSALMFHPVEIERQYVFQELGISIEQFQDVRLSWFLRSTLSNTIYQGDIPLYCLYSLLTDSSIAKKYKALYKIMVVDEFQDLSLLHLQILSFISSTLIVVGDMKQQIYQFNGACPQIVQEYFKIYKNAKICKLTNSFRCKQEIADLATRVILPNDRTAVPFTGTGEGGSIQVVPRRELDWKAIAKRIKADIDEHGNENKREVMFLYRNNASAIPIIEQLYSLGIPFRSSKFARIMDIPIFKDLCKLANVAWQPDNISFCNEALRLFPEFRSVPWTDELPPITVMKNTGQSLFEIKYRWQEQSSINILIAMQVAKKKIDDKMSAGVVINNLLESYDRDVINGAWWRFDNTKEYYFGLVGEICNSKTYPLMVTDENNKLKKNEDAMNAGIGVRCYTMHSAKGLEADVVYILDCDEGKFPNQKVHDNKVQAYCEYDAACDIRSERNLLYVALTRAKEEVIISYSGEPSHLISSPDSNKYTPYDEVYAEQQVNFDNVIEFLKMFKIDKSSAAGYEESATVNE